MPDLTPLQELDAAIEKFVKEVVEGDLSGWVLSWQVSQVQVKPEDQLPLSFASDFTFGAGTSPEAALGLSHVTAARLTKAIKENF